MGCFPSCTILHERLQTGNDINLESLRILLSLAGGASMIMVLPAVLDLRTNGETLSEITTFKTEATAFLDIIMKNMIGVYDTTKYGSIPFIYIGLLPLIFVSSISLRKKFH